MINGTKVSDFDATDGCPVHNTTCRKVYEFGRYRDAEVTTFTGCRCAVGQQFDQAGILQYDAVYYTNYNNATGLANLAKAVGHATFGS